MDQQGTESAGISTVFAGFCRQPVISWFNKPRFNKPRFNNLPSAMPSLPYTFNTLNQLILEYLMAAKVPVICACDSNVLSSHIPGVKGPDQSFRACVDDWAAHRQLHTSWLENDQLCEVLPAGGWLDTSGWERSEIVDRSAQRLRLPPVSFASSPRAGDVPRPPRPPRRKEASLRPSNRDFWNSIAWSPV